VQTALCDYGGRVGRRGDAPCREAAPQELRLKGSPGGKNYIGPPGPAGEEKDCEVVSVDSRVLITQFVDPDAAKRYGYMVYVRCT
jgi:hypothetical protein